MILLTASPVPIGRVAWRCCRKPSNLKQQRKVADEVKAPPLAMGRSVDPTVTVRRFVPHAVDRGHWRLVLITRFTASITGVPSGGRFDRAKPDISVRKYGAQRFFGMDRPYYMACCHGARTGEAGATGLNVNQYLYELERVGYMFYPRSSGRCLLTPVMA